MTSLTDRIIALGEPGDPASHAKRDLAKACLDAAARIMAEKLFDDARGERITNKMAEGEVMLATVFASSEFNDAITRHLNRLRTQ